VVVDPHERLLHPCALRIALPILLNQAPLLLAEGTDDTPRRWPIHSPSSGAGPGRPCNGAAHIFYRDRLLAADSESGATGHARLHRQLQDPAAVCGLREVPVQWP
jgi:hypothetical protein